MKASGGRGASQFDEGINHGPDRSERRHQRPNRNANNRARGEPGQDAQGTHSGVSDQCQTVGRIRMLEVAYEGSNCRNRAWQHLVSPQ